MGCIKSRYVGHSFVAKNSRGCRNEFKNRVSDVYSRTRLSKKCSFDYISGMPSEDDTQCTKMKDLPQAVKVGLIADRATSVTDITAVLGRR